MARRGWTSATFQQQAWTSWSAGHSGMINAPTGSGKTYSLLLPQLFSIHGDKDGQGLRLLWVIPIRALAREIYQSAERVIQENGLGVTVGIRSGDTSDKERARQKSKMPDVLITTPESLHLLLSRKGHPDFFVISELFVADEWHEMMGTKRGVQLELALSRLKSVSPKMQIWGISATIGNLPEAMNMLLGPHRAYSGILIRSELRKQIEVITLLPDNVTELPWAGHLGVRMAAQLLPVIHSAKSTLIFTNTRAQCEIWYRRLLECDPSLAGLIAMHHGSISKEIRLWVEEAISEGKLKAVVCTSSLDLGVDFAPVEQIVQVGGPKGIARFLQRAGRSGHRPGEQSRIYFLPTNSLELIEAAALRQAVKEQYLEDRVPMTLCFDVLVQYLVTLSLGEGFDARTIAEEVRTTFCFHQITDREWQWVMDFITIGGSALNAYDEFHRVVFKDDKWRVANLRIARRHRLSIGTIVSDTMMTVKWKRGGTAGHIEESFIATLNEGDDFWFAGQGMQLIRLKDLTAWVRPSNSTTGKIPSWQGGRLPLSSKMSDMLRRKLTEATSGNPERDPELDHLLPILKIQSERSKVPAADEFLIESFQSDEGFHHVFFPFEGRFVHEGLASLFAWRLSRAQSVSFSIAYNDYGFELLSNQPVDLTTAIQEGLFSVDRLQSDLFSSINAHELSRRKFREIAAIAGLVFKGFPGQPVRDRHLQSNAGLIFQVLEEYDPENLLVRQSMDEVLIHQLEFERLRSALERIGINRLVLTFPPLPTPFSFPVMVDRLREKMTSESLAERISQMQVDFSSD